LSVKWEKVGIREEKGQGCVPGEKKDQLTGSKAPEEKVLRGLW